MTDSINPTTNTHINSTPVSHELNVTNQHAAHKQEELTHLAPKILPFTLETSALDITGRLYIDLLELRKLISTASNDAELDKTAVKAIHELIDDIGEIILMKIPRELDKLVL
jgi:hypothetical protein